MVDPKEVNDMARLISLMNEGVSFEEPSASPEIPSMLYGDIDADARQYMQPTFGAVDPVAVAPPIANPAYFTEDTQAMKSILQTFYAASGSAAESLTKAAVKDSALREALDTQVTSEGTRVGSWVIRIYEDDEGLKSYDVANVHTGEPIADNLTLYDAAYALTRYLNEGYGINSAKIRNVLNTEAQYSRNRQDAANYRFRMKEMSNKSSQRYAIMEDRYEESLLRAKDARSRLAKIVRL